MKGIYKMKLFKNTKIVTKFGNKKVQYEINTDNDNSMTNPLRTLHALSFIDNDKEHKTFDTTSDVSTVSIDNRTYIDSDNYFHVYPIYVSDKQVRVICPHCGQIHYHGYSGDNDYTGHRVSDCFYTANKMNPGYIIEDIHDLTKTCR